MEEKTMKILKNMVRLAVVAAVSATVVISSYAAQKTEYSFTYEDQQIKLGESAASALKKLGKANSEKVLTNCADDDGVDKVHTYDDFDVYTTKINNKEIVNEITLKTADVKTEEGLKVGDTPAQVKKAYPGAAGAAGLYTVSLGDTNLIIDCGLKDDKVVSITYEYVAK